MPTARLPKSAIQRLIEAEASRQGMDPGLLVALARQESGLNPQARSPVGAIGLMQLMPGTARQLGVDPYDLHDNIRGGVRYLKQQQDRFGGDTRLALAAYNAGPGAVQKYGGVPPYKETQQYVRRILGALEGGVAAQEPTRRGARPAVSATEWARRLFPQEATRPAMQPAGQAAPDATGWARRLFPQDVAPVSPAPPPPAAMPHAAAARPLETPVGAAETAPAAVDWVARLFPA